MDGFGHLPLGNLPELFIHFTIEEIGHRQRNRRITFVFLFSHPIVSRLTATHVKLNLKKYEEIKNIRELMNSNKIISFLYGYAPSKFYLSLSPQMMKIFLAIVLVVFSSCAE